MRSIWVESLGRSFDEALDLLAAVIRDCTDELWAASMWEVPLDLFGQSRLALTASPSLTQQHAMLSPSAARLRGAWPGTP